MDNPSFFLEGIVKEKNQLQDFEGPLSLILLLLSKNKIEIRDISVSQILDQYLEYLEQMKSMDLEIASEFVQMASHLLYIKTRTLLAGDEEVSELEVLMASLEQLKCRDAFASVQKILPQLKKASEYGMLYYPKMPEVPPKAAEEYGYRHQGVELLSAMYRIYLRGVKPPEPEGFESAVPQRIIYSIKDKSRQILLRLKEGAAGLSEIYRLCASRSEIVAAFMSVLELCSMGSIRIERGDDGDYSLQFVGGDMDSIIDSIIE